MPLIPEISFDDIEIAEKYSGYDYKRCKNGLWGIYNVIKKIINEKSNNPFKSNVPTNKELSELEKFGPLYYAQKLLNTLNMVGENSVFEDDFMDSLVYNVIYNEKSNKPYKGNMPIAKELFELEKYGFDVYDLITERKYTSKKSLDRKDITQFKIKYNNSDFTDVILGLKLFSGICREKKHGNCFLTGDIRVAFTNAPKSYAPTLSEVYHFLSDEERNMVCKFNDKLEEIGCIRNLERDYMTRYNHPKGKSQTFATIYAIQRAKKNEIQLKLNLRHISQYINYLNECTESIRQSIITTEDCYSCKKACGGVLFEYNNIKYRKCPWNIFRFWDFSEQAINNYIELIELENNELINNRK